jgi:sugar lactone lactonase YvrE
MSVPCECCVLSGRGLCEEPITHPDESYRVWCDLVASTMRRLRPTRAVEPRKKKLFRFMITIKITLVSIYNPAIRFDLRAWEGHEKRFKLDKHNERHL